MVRRRSAAFAFQSVDVYGVYSVYYDAEGKIDVWSVGPNVPYGESLDEMRADLDRMREAFDKPVLNMNADRSEVTQ